MNDQSRPIANRAAECGNLIYRAGSAEFILGLALQGIGQLRVTFPTADRAIHEIDFPSQVHQAQGSRCRVEHRGDGADPADVNFHPHPAIQPTAPLRRTR